MDEHEQDRYRGCSSHSLMKENVNDDIGGTSDVNYKLPNTDDVMNLVFNELEDAVKFYFAYGKAAGFDIRKYSMKKDKFGVIVSQDWVCSRQGYREPRPPGTVRIRRAKSEIKCRCPARFRVVRDKYDGLLKVSRFIATHNHRLANPDNAKHLKCNRFITLPQQAHLIGLTESGLRPCKALGYMEHMEGEPGKLGFRRKDGYNFLSKLRHDMVQNGDVETAMAMLETLKAHDKDVVFEYSTDDNQSLARLFWTDGMARAEYELFGDVILFDSTYKTNTYHFPVVLFSGVNNHFLTCIFGAAVLVTETTDSYVWLLKTFKETMGGKQPITVLTDQDAAMRAAIELEFPEAKHRLCSWHLEQNAMQKVRKKNFSCEFGRLIAENYTPEEFADAWKSLVDKHQVANHPWVVDAYNKRESWSEAYCRGYFMANMTSTQRAESMNSLLKLDVNRGMNITQFIRHYHTCIGKIRDSFFERQADAELSIPHVKSSVLRGIEQHAATIYTPIIFYKVQDEIENEQGLVLQKATNEDDRIFTFRFVHYQKPNLKPCNLRVDWHNGKFLCECLMLETDGIPCRHIISALKCLEQEELPGPLIYERWTVDIGKILKSSYPHPFPFDDPQRSRYAMLQKEFAGMALKSSQTDVATTNLKKKLQNITISLEDDNLKNEEAVEVSNQKHDYVHGVARGRGAKRYKQQHCGSCGQTGHKVNTCAERNDNGHCNLTKTTNKIRSKITTTQARKKIQRVKFSDVSSIDLLIILKTN